VAELVSYTFSVGGLVSALVAGTVWRYARPRSRAPQAFLLTITVAYTLASTYCVSQAGGRLLIRDLRPLTPSDVPPGRTAIVLLGSGSFTARDWDGGEFSIVDPPAATRVAEALRVYRLVDPEWVIASGGKVRPDDPNVATGITMRDALVRLGVPLARVIVETKSRNTHEEAVVVAPILEDLDVANTVLVTSDLHMRRSLGTFRAAGIVAIPAIARHPIVGGNHSPILPSYRWLWYSGDVAHEALGIGYYAARGWYRF
jgi:uncharacterized SAM-binding protein YcdF (DUF218 family)